MKRYRFLTAEEERELFRRYRECGDQEACTALINSQTALATKMLAAWARRRGTQINDELMAEAPLAVYEAIKRFDVTRGARLSTALRWAVKNRVRNLFRGGAFHITIAKEKYHAAEVKVTRECVGFDHLTRDIRNKLEPATTWQPPDEAIARERSQEIIASAEHALSCLDKRSADIVRRNIMQGEILKSIGQSYGITKERTRQIVRDSLVKMRRFLAEGDLPRNHG